MFRLIVTNDEEVVQFARERGAGVFTAEKSPEEFAPAEGKAKESEVSKVYFLLRVLDIRPNIKGYHYIKFMMEQCQNHPDYHKRSLTKEIYPECANRFNTTVNRVERTMRHALTLSFEKTPESYSAVFGGRFTKAPTNSEFIGLVAEYFANK